jgi:peptidyl-prolyl cis-trans isomerase D
MLRFLRKYSTSTFIKVLYGSLALLFVIWGVGAVGGERVNAVAQVHGHTITRNQLERAEMLLQRRYEQLLRGATLPRGFDLRTQALDQLVESALLQNEAERLGLAVADDEVIRYVTDMPEFQEDGRFNHDILKRALEGQRDRGEFEEQVRNAIVADRLQNLATDGVQVSAAEVRERYDQDNEQAALLVARFSGPELAKDLSFTDAELEKALTAGGDRYKVPAKVRARYVTYKPVDFADQVHVSETQISTYYDENKDTRFAIPDEVRLRQIVIKEPSDGDEQKAKAARKKADDLLAKVKGGQDFATVARDSSEDTTSAKKGGELGLQTRQALAPELAAVAFALEVGTTSDIVTGPDGFYILKVDEKKPGGVKTLDEVRADIVRMFKDEKGLELAEAQADADRRAMVRGTAFATAVGTRPIQETEPFEAGEMVPGLGRLPDFAQAAHALNDGEPSNPISGDNAVYLLTPFERVEAHAPAIDQVRERLTADLRRERGQALAKEKAEAFLAAAKEAGGFEKAAAAAGLKTEVTDPFDRRTGPKGLFNADLRTDAFLLTAGQPLGPKVYPVGNDVVAVALKERTPADAAGFEAAKDGLRDSILQQKRTSAMSKYLDFLKERARKEGALEVVADALGRG